MNPLRSANKRRADLSKWLGVNDPVAQGADDAHCVDGAPGPPLTDLELDAMWGGFDNQPRINALISTAPLPFRQPTVCQMGR